MNRVELDDLLTNGENSKVEFKRDDVLSDNLAKELSALLNFEGGRILLGVENDGTPSGLVRSREEFEEWVMNIASENIQPSFIPSLEFVKLRGKVVGVIGVPADSPDKPYKAKQGRSWVTFMRVGSTSRVATREQEGRLYQASRIVFYDFKPVPGTGQEHLDQKRVENYFEVILGRSVPAERNRQEWQRLLVNTDFLRLSEGNVVATVAGLLVFGERPHPWLPQAGITATAYPGLEKEYNTVDEEAIRGPLVSIFSKTTRGASRIVDKGIIDQAVDFVFRNMGSVAWLQGARRQRKKSFPMEAVRESIVNAVVHRDYTLVGRDIEISLYQDRLEVISPGQLPNGVTVEKMKEGLRATRNGQLKDVLRDYGYVEHRGLGVPHRIVKAMRVHNGTEPDLIENDDRFTVKLWKKPIPAASR